MGTSRSLLRAKGTTQQLYVPDTNVLVTRFLTAQGVAELTDFMPWTKEPTATGADAPNQGRRRRDGVRLSLISAAFYLDRMLSGEPRQPWS